MGVPINPHIYFSVEIGGKSIPLITDAVIAMGIITVAIVLFVVLTTRKLKTVPTGTQKVAEMLVDFVNNFSKNQIGHKYKTFAPFICTLLLFIGVSNIVAIFNIFPSGETLSKIFGNRALEHFEFSLHPPTKNFNVTVCLAIIVIITVIVAEFRFKGFRGWLQGFYKPTPINGFVRLLDYFTRPVSLCLRLFGNVLGSYMAMSLLYGALPFVLPAFVSMYFDLFDGGLQTYVFIFLTGIYLSEATEDVKEVN